MWKPTHSPFAFVTDSACFNHPFHPALPCAFPLSCFFPSLLLTAALPAKRSHSFICGSPSVTPLVGFLMCLLVLFIMPSLRYAFHVPFREFSCVRLWVSSCFELSTQPRASPRVPLYVVRVFGVGSSKLLPINYFVGTRSDLSSSAFTLRLLYFEFPCF